MLKKLMITGLSIALLSSATLAFAQDVYVTKRGKKYHQEECRLIKDKGAEKISKKEAEGKGLAPCQKCFPEEVSAGQGENKPSLAKKEKTGK